MEHLSRLARWLRKTLDLAAAHTALEYLRRAFWLALALVSAVVTLWWIGSMKGSALWAIPAFLAVVTAAANGLWPLRNALESFTIGGPDDLSSILALPFIILFAAIIPCALALLSPVILIWNLFQALRVAFR